MLWAVLSVSLPASAAFADALLERSSGGADAVHVESHTRDACRPVHSADCVLCQVVARAGAPVLVSPDSSPRMYAAAAPAGAAPSLTNRGSERLSLPRAPPSV